LNVCKYIYITNGTRIKRHAYSHAYYNKKNSLNFMWLMCCSIHKKGKEGKCHTWSWKSIIEGGVGGKKRKKTATTIYIIFQSFKGIDLFVKKEGINLLGTCTSTFKIG
jgi:hypothetical protein